MAEPEQLPDGVHPLRWMVASSSGVPYRAYATLQEAKGDPIAELIMDADYGGQVLLSAPVAMIRVEEPVLRQLLADLEMITWGNGFDPETTEPTGDASMHFEPLPPGSPIPGGMGGGIAANELWLHSELDHELRLRPQVGAILSGRQDRLELPKGFPNVPVRNLAEAKHYPFARAHIVSGVMGWLVLDCRASFVASEEAMVAAAAELDRRLAVSKVGFDTASRTDQPTIRYYPARSHFSEERGEFWTYPDPRIKAVRESVEEVIRGLRAPQSL